VCVSDNWTPVYEYIYLHRFTKFVPSKVVSSPCCCCCSNNSRAALGNCICGCSMVGGFSTVVVVGTSTPGRGIFSPSFPAAANDGGPNSSCDGIDYYSTIDYNSGVDWSVL
jgi:hypothetical protein